jgi:hypothetical protein
LSWGSGWGAYKKGNVIQRGVYHKNMRILYRGKNSLKPVLSKIVAFVN